MGGWNGSGSVTLDYDWTNDRDAEIPIDADRMDAQQEALRGAIQNTIAKDGQNSPTANLPMGNNRHTGVGNASARNDYAAAGQVQDGAFIKGTAGGTADALTLTLSPAITAYAAGQVFVVRAGSNNATTTPTLNVNGVGAKTIKKYTANALVAGDIVANRVSLIAYDAEDDSFSLLNPMSAENFVENAITASSTDTLTNKTIDGDDNTLQDIPLTAMKSTSVKLDATTYPTTSNDETEGYGLGSLWFDDTASTTADVAWVCLDPSEGAAVWQRISLAVVGQSEAEAGTGTTPRYWTAQRVKQAIDALSGGGITVETAQATTSGTSFNFTGLTGASVIWVSLNGCSTDSTDSFLVQLGDSGGIESSGYTSHSENFASTGNATSSSGFVVGEAPAAASAWYGLVRLVHVGSNTWVSDHFISNGAATVYGGGGTKTLSAALTQLTFTRSASANFDAGSVGVAWI